MPKSFSEMDPLTDALQNVRKYANYVFDTKSFAPHFAEGALSGHALQTAKIIRGVERGPGIFLHGIMKRSGTVYVSDLLGLHPDLYAYPNKIWELPFLQQAGDILDMQERFFFAYKQNTGKVGDHDFLPLFGSALTAYLYAFVPQEQRMLLKAPGVEYLHYFFSVFPHEHLLLLVRDGRDVVNSTTKRWSQLRFADVCRRWDRSAKLVLKFHERYAGKEGYWLARFEDAVHDPGHFAREACRHFGLDPERYPYDKIASIPLQGSSTVKKEGKVAYWVPKPKGFNPVGRWHQWSGRQKRIFKKIAGQSLIELGYCSDSDW